MWRSHAFNLVASGWFCTGKTFICVLLIFLRSPFKGIKASQAIIELFRERKGFNLISLGFHDKKLFQRLRPMHAFILFYIYIYYIHSKYLVNSEVAPSETQPSLYHYLCVHDIDVKCSLKSHNLVCVHISPCHTWEGGQKAALDPN